MEVIRSFVGLGCRDTDWNEAFNFSKNTQFISNCAKKTKGNKVHIAYDILVNGCFSIVIYMVLTLLTVLWWIIRRYDTAYMHSS